MGCDIPKQKRSHKLISMAAPPTGVEVLLLIVLARMGPVLFEHTKELCFLGFLKK